MRGADTFTESLLTLRKLEDFVPADHPLRAIRKMATRVRQLIAQVFDFLEPGFKNVYYSSVSCCGSVGFFSLMASKTSL